jgi:hypothetical protein
LPNGESTRETEEKIASSVDEAKRCVALAKARALHRHPGTQVPHKLRILSTAHKGPGQSQELNEK